MKKNIDKPEKNLIQGGKSKKVESLNLIQKVSKENAKSGEEYIMNIKENLREMEKLKESFKERNEEIKGKLGEFDKKIKELDEMMMKVKERNELDKRNQTITSELKQLVPILQEKEKIIEEKQKVTQEVKDLNNIGADSDDGQVEHNLHSKWGKTQKLIEKLQNKKADIIANILQKRMKTVYGYHDK